MSILLSPVLQDYCTSYHVRYFAKATVVRVLVLAISIGERVLEVEQSCIFGGELTDEGDQRAVHWQLMALVQVCHTYCIS